MDDYREAQQLEQFHRNCIYLNIPEIVCGERINNLTPRLLARLTAARSPWIIGGDRFTIEAVFTLIWALHIDYNSKDYKTPKRLLKSLYSLGLDECVFQIDEFLALTYQDSLGDDGKPEKPIASGVSWLVYTFREEPFYFSEDDTLDTPLRKLYQELRCRRKSKGGSVMNPSDKIRGDFIGVVAAWIKGDESDTNEQRRGRLKEIREHYKQTLSDPEEEEAFLNHQFP